MNQKDMKKLRKKINSKEEIQKLAAIVKKHDLFLISLCTISIKMINSLFSVSAPYELEEFSPLLLEHFSNLLAVVCVN